MQHFVDMLQGYIINQLHEVSWKEFEEKLRNVKDFKISSQP
jgi:hypothetical protein